MTNEEALNWFKDDLKNGKCSEECPQCNAMERAIEALEKQVKKKPVLDTTFPSMVKWWRCPVCRHNNIETNDGFCHYCGQALDWSDTSA